MRSWNKDAGRVQVGLNKSVMRSLDGKINLVTNFKIKKKKPFYGKDINTETQEERTLGLRCDQRLDMVIMDGFENDLNRTLNLVNRDFNPLSGMRSCR